MGLEFLVVLERDREEGDGEEVGEETSDVLVDEGSHLFDEVVGVIGRRGKGVERSSMGVRVPFGIVHDETLDVEMSSDS